MKRVWVLLAALAALAGCGRQPAGPSSAFAPAEDERLVIYTSHKEEVYGPIIREFEERTGLWVQVETGGTALLLERIESEREAPRCDLLFGGGIDSLSACGDLFQPYSSPLAEDLPESLRSPDGSWTAFSLLPVVLIYNPMLVRVNPPQGWESLLDPAWRGRIAFASPSASGSSYTALATFLQALPGDDGELLNAFHRNLRGRVLSGSGAVVSAVADGACTVGVTLEETARKAIQAGSDVAILYPEEGTSALPDGMAVVAGCAHGENARRFIDFALGEDVQRHLAQVCQRRPVRGELFEDPEEAGGLTLIDYDLDWAVGAREDLLTRWQALEAAE